MALINPAAPDLKRRDWVALKAPAYVFGCNRRPGLVLPFLADQTHTLHIGHDYDLTPAVSEMQEQYRVTSPLLSNYRVFRGHQDMMRRFLDTRDRLGLFFEDDAVPNTPDWVSVTNVCLSRMGAAEVFSLYGRHFDRRRFNCEYVVAGRSVLTLRKQVAQDEEDRGGRHHVFGSMAYICTRVGAEKIAALQWEGIPCDCQFWDRTEFQFLDPSPFDHDRQQGSLLFPESCGPGAVPAASAILDPPFKGRPCIDHNNPEAKFRAG